MKFVIYNGQNKFTIDNASIPDIQKVIPSLTSETKDDRLEMNLDNFDLYNFSITSTRGVMVDEEEFIQNEDLQKEIDEGINWRQETIH